MFLGLNLFEKATESRFKQVISQRIIIKKQMQWSKPKRGFWNKCFTKYRLFQVLLKKLQPVSYRYFTAISLIDAFFPDSTVSFKLNYRYDFHFWNIWSLATAVISFDCISFTMYYFLCVWLYWFILEFTDDRTPFYKL